MLNAVVRLGASWQRSKHWMVSPDPAYERKKRRDRLIQMAVNHPDIALAWKMKCGGAVRPNPRCMLER